MNGNMGYQSGGKDGTARGRTYECKRERGGLRI